MGGSEMGGFRVKNTVEEAGCRGAHIWETLPFGDRFWRKWRGEKNDDDESKTQFYGISFLPGIKLFVH